MSMYRIKFVNYATKTYSIRYYNCTVLAHAINFANYYCEEHEHTRVLDIERVNPHTARPFVW